MKSRTQKKKEEEAPSSFTLAALLSQSFAKPPKRRVRSDHSGNAPVVTSSGTDASSFSGSSSVGVLNQPASPSTPSSSIGIKLQWPFRSLPWGQGLIDPSSLPVSSSQSATAQQLSVGCPPPFNPANNNNSHNNSHNNINNNNDNNGSIENDDDYGKSSLYNLDTSKSGISDASRNAAVTSAITDSIRQLLSEAYASSSTPDGAAPLRSQSTAGSGFEQSNAAVLPQKEEVFMSEGVFRLLRSVEILSK